MSLTAPPWCFFDLRKRKRAAIKIRDAQIEITTNKSLYDTMKLELIGNSNSDVSETHITERDVQQSFECLKVKRKTNVAKHIENFYCKSFSAWKDILFKIFPIYNFLKNYRREFLLSDIIAGISVAVAAISMGMSYATLANLPPAHGLYNNIFFPLIYMLFCTGRQVVVGTSAIEAVMAAEAVEKIVGKNSSEELWLSVMVEFTLLVGLILLLMRILCLGMAASFLADSVLSGFTTGAAVTIGTSQMKYLFGLKLNRASTVTTWWLVLQQYRNYNWGCVIICVLGIFIMAGFKYLNTKYFNKFPIPGPLIMLGIFTLISHYMHLADPPYRIPIIPKITAGLPSPKYVTFQSSHLLQLIYQSVLYCAVFFVIHISIGKSIAQKNDYSINANQELFAVGMAGIVGAFFQCFPIATSLSRSSISNVTGARTPLFNISNVLTVALAASVLTPLLHDLPMPALSSVIFFGVYWMMRFGEAWRLMKLWSLDFVLWIVTFIMTICFGATEGVIAGVVLSLLWLLKKNAFPETAVLGRLPGTTIYRNIERFPMAREVPGCKILRFDASLNFANADQFENKVLDLSQPRQSAHESLSATSVEEKSVISNIETKVVIIDAASVNDADVSAIRMLEIIARKLKNRGQTILFANWKGPMRDFLDRANFYKVLPAEHCFLSLHDAVLWAQKFYLEDSREPTPVTGLTFQYVIESVDDNEREWPVSATIATQDLETQQCLP